MDVRGKNDDEDDDDAHDDYDHLMSQIPETREETQGGYDDKVSASAICGGKSVEDKVTKNGGHNSKDIAVGVAKSEGTSKLKAAGNRGTNHDEASPARDQEEEEKKEEEQHGEVMQEEEEKEQQQQQSFEESLNQTNRSCYNDPMQAATTTLGTQTCPFEEFLQQEAVIAKSRGPPIISIRVGRGGGTPSEEEDDDGDLTLISELTTPPMRTGVGGPTTLYETPLAAAIAVVAAEGPNDDSEVSKVFQTKRSPPVTAITKAKTNASEAAKEEAKKSHLVMSLGPTPEEEEAGKNKEGNLSSKTDSPNSKVSLEGRYSNEIYNSSSSSSSHGQYDEDIVEEKLCLKSNTGAGDDFNLLSLVGEIINDYRLEAREDRSLTEDIQRALPPEPSSLIRSSRRNQPTEIGAVFVGGSRTRWREEEEEPTLEPNPRLSQAADDLDVERANQGLVSATLVREDSNGHMSVMSVAEEVEPRQPQEESNTKQGKKGMVLMIECTFAVVVLFAVGLGAGLASLVKKGDDDILLVVPTSTPSLAPWDLPSLAPTGALDALLGDLPTYTQDSLTTYGTPQWLAWEWLSNHPNLMSMAEWKKQQLFALVTFFYSFAGPQWIDEIRNDWLLYNTDECLWFSTHFGAFNDEGEYDKEYQWWDHYKEYHWGETEQYWWVGEEEPLSCGENGEFVSLRLASVLGISGHSAVIPPEIQLLSSLRFLVLQGNNINAPLADWLPTQFYQMTSLEVLHLGGNKLSGPIPPSFLGMTNLKRLSLQENSLTGTVPTTIGKLVNMHVLEVHSNSLTGRIPSDLGHLSKLFSMSFFDNSFSGSIPSNIIALPEISLFYVDMNALTGAIPIMPQLRSAGLYLNLFTGEIPTEVGLMSHCGLFATDGNPLGGVLPSQVGMMTSAIGLSFSHNFLSGSLPTQLGNLGESLAAFGAEGNSFGGSIPSEIGRLSNLNAIGLSKTGLTGHFPTIFGKMPFLQGLYIGDTLLSGSVPSQLGDLDHLGVLELSNMPLLSGSIPMEVSQLTLNVLKLSGSNRLTGTVPDTFCDIGIACTLDYWWLEYRADTRDCVLEFDCTDQLCGCDCPCANSLFTETEAGGENTTSF